MAQTSEASSRMKIIIGLFLFMTILYTFQGVILIGQSEFNESQEYEFKGLINNTEDIPEYQNYTSESDVRGGGEGLDPIGMITGFFSFAFLQSFPDMPDFARAILGLIVTVVLIISFYLIYQSIRDWIPFI